MNRLTLTLVALFVAIVVAGGIVIYSSSSNSPPAGQGNSPINYPPSGRQVTTAATSSSNSQSTSQSSGQSSSDGSSPSSAPASSPSIFQSVIQFFTKPFTQSSTPATTEPSSQTTSQTSNPPAVKPPTQPSTLPSSQTSPQARSVQATFAAYMTPYNDDNIYLYDTSISGNFALQLWKGDNTGGEGLLKFDTGQGIWVVITGGGGSWSVYGLVQAGVPRDTATALLAAMPQ